MEMTGRCPLWLLQSKQTTGWNRRVFTAGLYTSDWKVFAHSCFLDTTNETSEQPP